MPDIRIVPAAPAVPGVTGEADDARLSRYLRPGTLSLTSLPPLSLYVHLPWCLKKCPYCDFNSHELRGGGELPQRRYLAALRCDLEAALPFIWGRRVHSIFIGGGTPSLFAPESIDQLLGDIRARLPIEPGAEVTLEANPGTFERDRFRSYRAAGVTRLSIGVQSFDDRKLTALGRVHDAAQARAAVEEAAAAFDTYNIDLMYALPGQTLADFEGDLAQALALAPPHLSIYHLTIEPNTVFGKYPPVLPDHDLACDMLDHVVQACASGGLDRYEVSAFARTGHRCVHNLNYWKFGDYLGIGAGAHSKLSYPHRVVRQVRHRDPQGYMAHSEAGHCIASDEEVPRRQLPFEFMLGALRLRDGFELAKFSERTGLPPGTVQHALDGAQQRGWIARDLQRVRSSALGFDFLNDLQSLFLVDEPN